MAAPRAPGSPMSACRVARPCVRGPFHRGRRRAPTCSVSDAAREAIKIDLIERLHRFRRMTSFSECHMRLSLVVLFAANVAIAQSPSRPKLDSAAVDDIATLLLLEDVRRFDTLELGRLLAAKHPEIRRRAQIAVARINDKRGVALLRARPLDADTAIAATTVFAVGQLRDSLMIPWFDSLLSSTRTPPTVATEAAFALGKIRTAAARETLARYL